MTSDDDLTEREREAFHAEQRRLFYVGLTRTREVLVLSSYVQLPLALAMRLGAERGRFLSDQLVTVQASEFLAELGPERPRPVAGTAWRYV